MTQGDKKRGFLIMPFDHALDWLHAQVIHASVAQGVHTSRADDSFQPGPVVQQILDDIDASDVIFAVCTGKNANVFFELGYAWRNHTPILIAEDTHDFPFDILGNRTALYGRESPGSDRDTLRFRLEKAIASVLAEERLPRGRRLAVPPQPKRVARLTARIEGSDHKVLITNAGTIDIQHILVQSPKEAASFHLHEDDLPIDVLRPGDTVRISAFMTMGGGPRIFDLTLTGKTGDGESVEFKSKISL